MNRTLPLVLALLILGGTGCAHHARTSKRPRAAVNPAAHDPLTFSNAQAYDFYVVNRTDELISSGKYSRADAAALARKEAVAKYGNRTRGRSLGSTMTWPTRRSNEVSAAELDAAIARSRY